MPAHARRLRRISSATALIIAIHVAHTNHLPTVERNSDHCREAQISAIVVHPPRIAVMIVNDCVARHNSRQVVSAVLSHDIQSPRLLVMLMECHIPLSITDICIVDSSRSEYRPVTLNTVATHTLISAKHTMAKMPCLLRGPNCILSHQYKAFTLPYIYKV